MIAPNKEEIPNAPKTFIIFEDINKYKLNNPDEKLYFNFDGHWNNNGHRVISKIISNNLNFN